MHNLIYIYIYIYTYFTKLILKNTLILFFSFIELDIAINILLALGLCFYVYQPWQMLLDYNDLIKIPVVNDLIREAMSHNTLKVR